VAGLPLKWLEGNGGEEMERMEFSSEQSSLEGYACPNEANCGLYDYVMVEGRGLKLVRKNSCQRSSNRLSATGTCR